MTPSCFFPGTKVRSGGIVLLTVMACLLYTNVRAQTHESPLKLPSEINNAPSFDKALAYFRKYGFEANLDKSYSQEHIDSMLYQFKDWSAAKGTKLQQLLGRTYHFYRFIENDGELIREGNELQTFREIRESHEYLEILQFLYNAYFRTEQYNEILQLIPVFYAEKARSGNITANELDRKNYDIATIYFHIKNYSEAIRHFNFYLNTPVRKNLFDRASVYNDIADSYSKENKADSAIFYYNLALKNIDLYREDAQTRFSAAYRSYFRDLVLAGRELIEGEKGNYDRALPLFFKVLAGSIRANEQPIVMFSYYNIASILYRKNDPTGALVYLDSLFAVLKAFNNNEYFVKGSDLAGQCYLLRNEPAIANDYFRRSMRFRDSVEQKKAAYSYSTALVKLKNKLSEDELAGARRDIAESGRIVFLQRMGLLLLAGLLLIIFGLGYNQYQNKKRIARQNLLISNSLREKELLLREIHHRVKNNLQIVSGILQLQSTKHRSPEVLAMVKESQYYIESMSMVHHLLYLNDNFSAIEIRSYLQKLGSLIIGSSAIKLEIASEQILLSNNAAIPLGLMYCELLLNSLKHAFSGDNGHIAVSFTQIENGAFTFIYNDNGKGLPEDFNLAGCNTLGLKLVKMLAEEMNADIVMGKGEGMKLTVVFKDLA